jgi:hypothetical protein
MLSTLGLLQQQHPCDCCLAAAAINPAAACSWQATCREGCNSPWQLQRLCLGLLRVFLLLHTRCRLVHSICCQPHGGTLEQLLHVQVVIFRLFICTLLLLLLLLLLWLLLGRLLLQLLWRLSLPLLWVQLRVLQAAGSFTCLPVCTASASAHPICCSRGRWGSLLLCCSTQQGQAAVYLLRQTLHLLLEAGQVRQEGGVLLLQPGLRAGVLLRLLCCAPGQGGGHIWEGEAQGVFQVAVTQGDLCGG